MPRIERTCLCAFGLLSDLRNGHGSTAVKKVQICCPRVSHFDYRLLLVFIPGIFWGGISPPKKLTILPKQLPNCSPMFFFGRGNELQIYHRNILLVDNKHWKLFVIKQSKCANLCLKCTKIRLAARLRPTHWGERMHSSRPHRPNGGLLLMGGAYFRGRKGSGWDTPKSRRVKYTVPQRRIHVTFAYPNNYVKREH